MLGLITGAAGTVINEQLDRAREDRTNKQTEKLMGIQQQNQRNLNQQGHDLSLKHWRDTSYPMQKMMMEKAGLNPALMYGNAGTGGSTGSGSGGSASMGQAASSQGKAMDINNSMLVKAQIETLEAQAKKTNQEADNLAGGEGKAGIEKEGVEYDNLLKSIQYEINENTKDMDIAIKWKYLYRVIRQQL